MSAAPRTRHSLTWRPAFLAGRPDAPLLRLRPTGVLCRSLLILIALAPFSAPAVAHPVPFSYLDLRVEPGGLGAVLIVHVLDVAHDLGPASPDAWLTPAYVEARREQVMALLRARMLLVADGVAIEPKLEGIEPLPDRQAARLRFGAPWESVPGTIEIRCNLFPYDPQHQTFLNVYEGGTLVHQTILQKDRPVAKHFTGTRQGTLAVLEAFVASGIAHIAIGPDHILFIIGLLLLGGSLPRLLTIVTAFTVGHSITLSLAALDLFTPPSQVIEPAIALSIVYVGADNMLVGREGRDMRAWIALFFGFVHGFGFAAVLKEFGLPRQALGWSLFSFNAGVEIGQLCIVVIVASLLAAIRRQNSRLARRIVTAGSVGVMMAGAYWFVERVFFQI